ncbi:MAG: hypothetical protein M3069_22475 [Chloroflexota bacterium]|nr:hypothetical protein [Chloroflexota bacterium]
MAIQFAALIVVDRKQTATPKPAVLANLDPDEVDFLQRHVDYLRTRINQVEVPPARFRPASSMPGLLKKVQRARKDDFLKVSDIFASRLVSSMASATNPMPGLMSVLITVNGRRERPTGGRRGIHGWPRVSPLVASEVPTRVAVYGWSSFLPG